MRKVVTTALLVVVVAQMAAGNVYIEGTVYPAWDPTIAHFDALGGLSRNTCLGSLGEAVGGIIVMFC